MTTHPSLENLPVTEEDLPIWMRRAMRGNDWGALLSLGFSALAAWYFILGSPLPAANITESYAFMTADYAATIQEGRLYPRWAPHALGGYGAPIYHYHPPGAPYLSGMIAVLFTGDAVAAVRVVYVIAFLLAGVGTYGVVVRHRGAPAAILAVVLYVTSPYLGLTAPHVMGDVPGMLALGMLPVFLWSVDRLVSANYPQDFAFVTLSAAALILTEPRVAVVGAALALAMLAWRRTMRRGNPHYVRLVVLALASSMLLASFYWLPALAERHYVRWDTHIQSTRPLFLTASAFFEPARQLDPAALVPDVPLTLGWLRLGVLGMSVLGVVVVQRRYTIEALFLSAGTVLMVVGLFVLPSQLWLLGVITLCFCMGSGAALSLRDQFDERGQRLVLAIALLVVLAASHPAWLAPVPRSTITDLSVQAQRQHELSGYGVAVVPHGSAFPTTLAPAFDVVGDTLAGIDGVGVARVSGDVLSRTLQVSPLNETSHASRFQVMVAEHPRNVELLLAYFPGWRAAIAGRPVPITENPDGLAVLRLPTTEAPNAVLSLWLGSTRPRLAGWALSALALVTLFFTTRYRYRHALDQFHAVPLLTVPEVRLVGTVFIFAMLVIGFAAAPGAPYSIRVPAGSGLSDAAVVDLRSTVGVNLLGYEFSRTQLRHGDRLLLTLYWSTLRELTDNYRVQVTLQNTETELELSKPVIRYPGGAPPTRWTQNQYVTDIHYIEIAERIPPGNYQVLISLEVCDVNEVCRAADERPTFFERNLAEIGEQYTVPQTITVRP